MSRCVATVVQPLLSDYYPPVERTIAYGVFFLTIPVGGALGFVIGGVLAAHIGIRWMDVI
jgi:MFS family permease